MSIQRLLLCMVVAGCVVSAASAQEYVAPITGFETYEDGANVLFQNPKWSATTVRYDQDDPEVEPDGIWGTDPDTEAPWSVSQVQQNVHYNGSKAYEIYFLWGNPADTDDPPGYTGEPDTGANDYIRATTYTVANIDRPSVHLGGKIKFKLALLGYLDGQYTPAPGSSILMNLAIKETGKDLALGATDTSGGDIEFVYFPGSVNIPEADTNGLIETYPGGLRIYATTTWPPAANEWHDMEIDLSQAITRGFWENGDDINTCLDHVLDATMVGDGVNRGNIEHIGFTNDPEDTTGKCFFVYIDDVEFVAPEPDPLSPPVIQIPLVAGDTSVKVKKLIPSVSQVKLYKNDTLVVSENITNMETYTFFNLPALSAGDVYTATQVSSQTGMESDPSDPVEVMAEPPLFWFGVLLDEGGSGSCNYTYGWEWIGVTELDGSSWNPIGIPLFQDDSNWQTIEVSLIDNDQITAGLGGDGMLAPSPTGYYTIDSIWFANAVADQTTNGPWTVMVDAVEAIMPGGDVWPLLSHEDGVDHWPYSRGQSPDAASATYPTNAGSFDGVHGEYIEWTYGTEYPKSCGVLQRTVSCGTSALIPDTAEALRFHLVVRGQRTNPDIPLPTVGTIIGNQTEVTVDCNTNGVNSVTLYVNGTQSDNPVTPVDGQAVFSGLLVNDGDSVTAKQTISGLGESDFSWPRAAAAAPSAPTLGKIVPGSRKVLVENILKAPGAMASQVTIYVNDVEAGVETVFDGTTTLVNVSPVSQGDVVTATQTVNGAESDPSAPVTVEYAEPALALEWIQTSSVPWPNNDAVLLNNGEYVYLLGGRTDEDPDGGTQQATPSCWYAPILSDGSIGAWTQTASLPGPRAAGGGSCFNGRLYFWGGWDVGWPTRNTCYYADPNPDGSITSWVESTVLIPNSPDQDDQIQMDAFGSGDLGFNNTLYIINGERNDGSNSEHCWYSRLMPNGDYGTWIQTNEPDSAGSWFHGVAFQNTDAGPYIYRVAGNYRGTNEQACFRAPINEDGSLGEWIDEPAVLPYARYEHACIGVGSRIFVVGGLYGSTPQEEVYYTTISGVDGSIDGWRDGPEYPLATSRVRATSYTVNGVDYLLVVSGGPYYSTWEKHEECYYTMVAEDEDGDGVPDASDDCPGTMPGMPVGPDGCILGDADKDGDVDLADFAGFQACFASTESTCLEHFDMDSDNDIDLDDYSLFYSVFTGP